LKFFQCLALAHYCGHLFEPPHIPTVVGPVLECKLFHCLQFNKAWRGRKATRNLNSDRPLSRWCGKFPSRAPNSNSFAADTPKRLTHALPLISTCRFAHLRRECPHSSNSRAGSRHYSSTASGRRARAVGGQMSDVRGQRSVISEPRSALRWIGRCSNINS
jgi:hypothetical protein